MSAILIPPHIIDEMIVHARELDPYECCGLLAGKDGTVTAHYRITNTVANDQRALQVFTEANVKQLGHLQDTTRAEVAYFMDPKEMLVAFKDMRRQGAELSVIYHSHTHSPAYPSQTDIGLAYYPDVVYLIISLADKHKPDLQAFRIKSEQVTPTQFRTA